MKLHIIPAPEFTELLLAIIHGLANQSHKVKPTSPLPQAPPVNPVNQVNPVTPPADSDLDAKISPQVHRIIEHAIRIAEACACGPRIAVASSDHLLAAILLSTTRNGFKTNSRRYLESKGITLQDLCQSIGLPRDCIDTVNPVNPVNQVHPIAEELKPILTAMQKLMGDIQIQTTFTAPLPDAHLANPPQPPTNPTA